jgi:hypothetical protein
MYLHVYEVEWNSTYVYVYSWFAYDDFMSMTWLYNMYVERDKVERNTCVFV